MSEQHKTLIAVPALDICATPFAYSLVTMLRSGPSKVTFIVGMAVHEARNKLAQEAIDDGCDRILWIDSDMTFAPDMMIALDKDMDDGGYDLVCGIYFKRRLPVVPVIYSAFDMEAAKAATICDYPQNTIFPIAGCGFGAVMTSVDIVKRVQEKFGAPFTPIHGFGEDLSFCARAVELGAKMACDSRINVGHAGQIVYDERMYQRPEKEDE